MAKRQPKPQPTWADVKAKLAAFDRTGLLELIHHLYAAHNDNQAFLHARFGLGQDVLEPYKKTIDRWFSCMVPARLGPSQTGHEGTLDCRCVRRTDDESTPATLSGQKRRAWL